MEDYGKVKQYSRHRKYSRVKTGLVGLIGYAASVCGCASIPSRDNRTLETYNNHIATNDVDAALESLISSQIGRRQYDFQEAGERSERSVVVLANRGLDDDNNSYQNRVFAADENSNGIASDDIGFRQGEYEWEWIPPAEGSHIHRTRFYQVVDHRETDQAQRNRLALELVWNTEGSDDATVTLYRTRQPHVSFQQDISRAGLRTEFYHAMANAGVRENSTGYRIGMFVLDHLLLKRIRNLPWIEIALNNPNTFELNNPDESNNGLAAYLGEPDISLNPVETWRHTSYMAIVPRLITRFFVNLFNWPSEGREERFRNGTADPGDYILRALQSPFKTLDSMIAGYFGIDRQLYVLFAGYSQSGNRLTSEEYWGNVIDVAERAASMTYDASSGGGSSPIPGVPLTEDGGLQGTTEGGNLLTPRGTP